MKRFAIALAASTALLVAGCGLPQLAAGLAGPPPTAAALNATSIDEAGIDLIRDLFDVGLFGVDALTDAGKIVPGTPQARNIARLIRQIAGFLGAADSAQKAGQSATYTEALRNARSALKQFQSAIGMPAATTGAALAPLPADTAAKLAGYLHDEQNLSDPVRLAFADRLDRPASN